MVNLWKIKFQNISIITALVFFVFCATAFAQTLAPAAEYKVTAWLVPWDNQAGIDSITRNVDYIDAISPFWYHVNEDGSLTVVKDGEDPVVTKLATDNKIPLIPTISNSFDGKKISGFLNDPVQKKNAIKNIVDLVNGKKYDGIDIDYEGILSADMDAFTAFIKDLRAELNKTKKKLTIAIMSKTANSFKIYGNRGQDWPKLALYVDEFRIMAYDYGWRGSIPRSIAPAYWVEDVIKYAVANVPKEKIYLGVPFYGYGWSSDFFSSYTYSTISFILEKYGVDFQYDPVQKTNRLFYVSDQDIRDPKIAHEVWFENHVSLEPKLEFVTKYGIGGISIWRLGKEDNENWRSIRKILKGEPLGDVLFFRDVDQNTKYYKYITRLADLGIVKGVGVTKNFAPLAKVNRAEILKMALNSFAKDISKYAFSETRSVDFVNPFKDILDNEWYFGYVQTAVDSGIVKGYPDGTFKPAQNIKRAEALKLALESAGIDMGLVASTASTVGGVTGEWYAPYKKWALDNNMYTNANFKPEEEITRAEAAFIVAKVIEAIE